MSVSVNVIVGRILIQIVKKAGKSPPVDVLAEVARKGAHHALDRYKVPDRRVLLRVLPNDRKSLRAGHD
jgi:hypothetical protein